MRCEWVFFTPTVVATLVPEVMGVLVAVTLVTVTFVAFALRMLLLDSVEATGAVAEGAADTAAPELSPTRAAADSATTRPPASDRFIRWGARPSGFPDWFSFPCNIALFSQRFA